jgi:hypothetical protein
MTHKNSLPARTWPTLKTWAITLAASLAAFATNANATQDWVIPTGQTVEYDTGGGRKLVDRLVIERGAKLRVVGTEPLVILARDSIVVEGTLDVSGYDGPNIPLTPGPDSPVPGAEGVAGGGDGGTASQIVGQGTPAGGAGFGPTFIPGLEAQGGESGYGLGAPDTTRGAGGGGGVLAHDYGLTAAPHPPGIDVLGAKAGKDGVMWGYGAISGAFIPQGGAHGYPVFFDQWGDNDFWGRRLNASGKITVGELERPLPGFGGGAGGDAMSSGAFPLWGIQELTIQRGGGGGGGGGLAVVLTRKLIVRSGGRILVNGGRGGSGEFGLFNERLGGGGGGGSGGTLIIQATTIDLRQADDVALQSVGGRGGEGRIDNPLAPSAGGHGGPGVIQVHTADGTLDSILLPAGKHLHDLTVPAAAVLLPF